MKIVLVFLTFIMLTSCNNNSIPDVSGIKVNLTTERFERDFFSIDTADIGGGMMALQKKYPDFTFAFTLRMLGIHSDTTRIKDTAYTRAMRTFIRDYKALNDSAMILYPNFDNETAEIKKSLQFVKYYFPDYTLPNKLITFTGPIDAFFQTSFGVQGDIKSDNILGIGLQLHLGANSSYYQNELGQELYPTFISRNFDREHIPVNCMKLIIDELYPEGTHTKPLLDQMVEKGKRFYLLDKFLPEIDEYLKLGYTREQLKDCYGHEAVIWDFFLDNELLNNAEPNIIKNYIGESPKTQELGENSPGNIGSFAGWQIVKKYMSKNPDTKLDELMKMDPREIYSASKYKPK